MAARLERLLTKEAAVGPDTCHLFGKKVSGGRVLHPNVGAITPGKTPPLRPCGVRAYGPILRMKSGLRTGMQTRALIKRAQST